jgi:hypothetical protein
MPGRNIFVESRIRKQAAKVRLKYRNIFACVLICVVSTLILLEIALQIHYRLIVGQFVFDSKPLALFAGAPHAGHQLRPNVDINHNTPEFSVRYVTNVQGFRVNDPRIEFPLDKHPNEYRVLVLGPSFAFGWGVNYEETFAAVLERQLQQESCGKHIQFTVINAGVPSLAPAFTAERFDYLAHTMQFDQAVVVIYGSMAIDPSPVPDIVTSEGYLTRPDKAKIAWLRSLLASNSTIYTYGSIAWKRLQALVYPYIPSKSWRVLGGTEGRFEPFDASGRLPKAGVIALSPGL